MRTILTAIGGVIAGSIVIAIVEYGGHQVFPLPEDVDPADMESLKANAHRIPAGAQLSVCLAWALGAVTAGWTATRLNRPTVPFQSSPFRPAFIAGAILLLAAIVNLSMIPSPIWFWCLGLVVFLPGVMIGWRLASDVSNIKVTQIVSASPAAVFAIAVDFPSASEHISGITKVEMLTEGDVGVGTRFRETRVMMGQKAVEEMEVTQFESDKRYTIEADSCGSHFRTEITFDESAEGTEVNMHTKIEAVSLFAVLMSPMAAVMMATMTKCLQDDLRDLKLAVESQL